MLAEGLALWWPTWAESAPNRYYSVPRPGGDRRAAAACSTPTACGVGPERRLAAEAVGQLGRRRRRHRQPVGRVGQDPQPRPGQPRGARRLVPARLRAAPLHVPRRRRDPAGRDGRRSTSAATATASTVFALGPARPRVRERDRRRGRDGRRRLPLRPARQHPREHGLPVPQPLLGPAPGRGRRSPPTRRDGARTSSSPTSPPGAIDLDGYVLKSAPQSYHFGRRLGASRPAARCASRSTGEPEDDEPLDRSWGFAKPILRDAGDVVSCSPTPTSRSPAPPGATGAAERARRRYARRVAAGGTADAVARRVEIQEGRVLVVGATGDAAELVLRRDGAEPLRAPFRAARGRARGRAAARRARRARAAGRDVDAAAAPHGGPARRGGGRGRAAAGWCACGPSAAAAALAVVVEPLPPHAEARSVRVEDGALAVSRATPRRAAAAAALVARHRARRRRGGASTPAVAAGALRGAPAARPARPRGRLGPAARRAADRRAPRRPARQEGGRRVPRRTSRAGSSGGRSTPSRTTSRCASPPPAPPAAPPPGARRGVAPPAAARRRSPSPSTGSRSAWSPRCRAAPRAPRAGRPRRCAILLLHAYGLGGTVRTSFNLAAGLAGRDVELISLMRRRAAPFFPFPAPVDRASTTSARRPARRRARLLGRLPSVLIHPEDYAYPYASLWTDVALVRALRAIRGGVLVTTRPAFNLLAARLARPGRGHDRPGAHELHVAPAAPRGRPAPPLRRARRARPC